MRSKRTKSANIDFSFSHSDPNAASYRELITRAYVCVRIRTRAAKI